MPQDPQIPTPLESGATDHPGAPQSAPSRSWYKVRGEDNQWYTTQADSPEAAKTKVWTESAKRAIAFGNPAYDDPTKSTLAKVGAAVPQFAVPGLQLAQKYLVDPLERMAAKGAEIGGKIATFEQPLPGDLPGRHGINPDYPVVKGIAKGVGETAGGIVGDPRNWPLMGASSARPIIQKVMTRGFQALMTKGTYDAAKELYTNWEKYSPEQRAELGTKAGLSALMTASLFKHGTPAPEDPAIAGTGKTESEVKTPVSNSSPKTGLAPKALSYEELKARIAAIEERNKPKAPVSVAPAEVIPSKVEAQPVEPARPATKPVPRPIEADLSVKEPNVQERVAKITEQARPAETPPSEGRAIPVEDLAIWQARPDLHDQILREAKGRNLIQASGQDDLPRLAQKQGEMRTRQDKANAKASVSPEVGREAAPPEAAKPAIQPVPSAQETKRPGESVRPAQKSPLANPELLTKALSIERKEGVEQLIPVGGERKSGLSHGLTEQEAIETERLLKNRPGFPDVKREVHPEDPLDHVVYWGEKVDLRDPENQGLTEIQYHQKLGEAFGYRQAAIDKFLEGVRKYPATSEPRSVRGDLGERPPQPPAASRPIDFAERLKVAKERVEAMQADPKYKGVSKSRLQEIVSEQMRKELGAVGGGPDDPKARREAKIKNWLDQLRDPKANPEVLDTAWKQLNAYGLSHDDIIKRMSGAESFAVDPHDALAKAERERESLEERLGPNEDLDKKADSLIGGLMDTVDRVKGKQEEVRRKEIHDEFEKLVTAFRQRQGRAPNDLEEKQLYQAAEDAAGYRGSMSHIQATGTEKGMDLFRGEGLIAPADREAARKGSPDVRGVKGADIEELERMYAAEDLRKQVEKKLREGERGSVSFKRLSEEERLAASPFRRLADVLDRIANVFERGRLNEEEFSRQSRAQDIIRAAAAEKSRSHLEVMEALRNEIKRHDNPVNERQNFIDFMDAGEGKPGSKFLEPKDQALAQALHEMFNERWEKIKEVKDLEGDGIENYLAHIWDKPNKGLKTLAGIVSGRRPLEGSARFLKNRFYQYASEGIEHGLQPATWNPVRLQLGALFDIDRFLMAHDIKDSYKEAGLVKFGHYKTMPPGWQTLDDKIFKPKAMKEGGLVEYGQYFAPPEVAKIFNRYLSPGLRGNFFYDKISSYGNYLNMANLGISAYHGTMISLVSATSDVALGLQKVFNYGDLRGTKDILRGSVGSWILRSAALDYKLGREIQSEAINPTGNARLQSYVDNITRGGGRFKQDPFYAKEITARSGFMNWLRLGKEGKIGEMLSTPVRAFAGPIMEKFVPRVKVGIAARMMEAKMADLTKQGITDTATISNEMGKIWDSVDNRAGQMVYDNLFWNKMGKDAAFLGVRAVGWDLGSIREYGGAGAIDLPRQAAKLLRGERPELTHRLAFSVATAMTIGTFGAMVHYLMTGKAPDKPEDCFFPGPHGAKISFPSYVKDIVGFKRSPFQTVLNKFHPTWSQFIQYHENADFYGTEIYHPGDPWTKQRIDIAKWYLKSWQPYGITGLEKRMERGESFVSAASGLAGFMPAPAYIDQSPAERLSETLAKRTFPHGPRTAEDAARYELVQRFERQVGAGQKLDMKELTDAWRNKRIQDTDVARIYDNVNTPKLQRDFKELNLPDALAVMREADPNERIQLKPLLMSKYGQIEKYPLDQQINYDKQIKSYFQ